MNIDRKLHSHVRTDAAVFINSSKIIQSVDYLKIMWIIYLLNNTERILVNTKKRSP